MDYCYSIRKHGNLHYVIKLDSKQNCKRYINQLIEIDKNWDMSYEKESDLNYEEQYYSKTQSNDTSSDPNINNYMILIIQVIRTMII